MSRSLASSQWKDTQPTQHVRQHPCWWPRQRQSTEAWLDSISLTRKDSWSTVGQTFEDTSKWQRPHSAQLDDLLPNHKRAFFPPAQLVWWLLAQSSKDVLSTYIVWRPLAQSQRNILSTEHFWGLQLVRLFVLAQSFSLPLFLNPWYPNMSHLGLMELGQITLGFYTL